MAIKNIYDTEISAVSFTWNGNTIATQAWVNANVSTPTLDAVTTAGGATSNDITVGNITASSSLLGGSYTQPAGSSWTTSNSQLILGGAHNAGFNTGTKAKLVISGYDNDGSTIYPIFVEDENGYADFWIKNRPTAAGASTAFFSGKVGIGTTTPTAPLHIEGGTTSEVIKVEADTSPYIRFVQNGTNVGFLQFSGANAYLANQSAGSLLFRTNNTDKMVITSAGDVGIGTTSPVYKLDVTGDIRTSGAFRGVNIALSGYIDLTGDLNHRSNIRVLNKLGTNWITWATRDTSGADSKVVLSNVKGDISQFTNDSGYLTAATASSTYLPLSGGTLTGSLEAVYTNTSDHWAFRVNTNGSNSSGFWTTGEDVRLLLRDDSGNIRVDLRPDGTSVFSDNLNVIGTFSATGYNNSNWDTAYGWGDHAAAGYLTSYSETDTLATVVARGAFFGTTNQGYVASGGTYGTELRKIRRITLTAGASNWDGDNHAILSENISGATTDSISINSYNGIHLRLDSNNNQANNLTNFTIHNNTTTNTNELFRVTGDGNVGIGVTNPWTKLVLDGDPQAGTANAGVALAFDGTDYAEYGYRFKANGANYYQVLYDGSAINWKNYAGGASYTTRMSLTNGGNLGIGTTSPSSMLEIRKATATHQLVSLNRPASDVAAMYLGNDSSSPANGVIASNYSDLILGRDQSGTLTEHVRIKRDGNVGIGTTSPSYKLDVNGSMHSTNITIADAIYHEGDTNTVVGFGTDTINLSTGGGVRATINNSGTKFNNDVVVVGGATLSLGERGEPDDLGRTVLLEGAANAGSGEGAGRIFFSEHNSTTAGADSYGLSLYYEGDPNIALPSGFQPNTGNGTWSLRRHNNSVNGDAIMSGSRTNSDVQFGGSITIGSGVTLSESTDRADLLSVTSSTSGWGGLQITNTAGEGIWSFMVDNAAAGIYDDQNGEWAVYCVENSYVQLRHNGTGKLTTSSSGVDVAGRIYLSANNSHIEFNTSASSGHPKIQMGADADFSFVNTAGSTNLHIENGGNVGIGTTAPNALLALNGDGNIDNYQGTLRIYNTDTADPWAHIAFPDSLAGNTNANNHYLIGRGTSYATRVMSFHIPNDGQYGDSQQPFFGFYSSGADLLHSVEAETGKSYFKGNVGIGTTSPSEKLEVSGNILASGDITAFSDARLKENVKTLPNALELVKAMRGVTYNKIGEEKQSIGVIAQEVQAVLPQLVSEHKDEMLSVAYGNITAVLIEAIKEQQEQIDELKAIINGLTK